MKFRNIFLIGPMGAGKTTIGKNISKMSALLFFDSDHELQKSTGVSLDWLVTIEKESGLRNREHNILKKLVQKQGIILATGGGTILRQENRTLLMENGLIIYLKTSIKSQKNRTRHSKENRPALNNTDDLDQTFTQLAQEREKIYLTMCHLSYDTTTSSAQNVSNKIIKYLKTHQIFDFP